MAWKKLKKHVYSRMDVTKQYAFLPPIGSRAMKLDEIYSRLDEAGAADFVLERDPSAPVEREPL